MQQDLNQQWSDNDSDRNLVGMNIFEIDENVSHFLEERAKVGAAPFFILETLYS